MDQRQLLLVVIVIVVIELHYLHRKKHGVRYRLPVEYTQRGWSLNDWPRDKCVSNTRFYPEEIDSLVKAFDLDEGIRYRSRYSISGRDGLAMLLYKLAAPSYLYRDQDVFGCSSSRISSICTDIIVYLAKRYESMLAWHPLLTYDFAAECARFITPFGGQGVVWGFIDGTFRPFCRPLDGQRLVYSGHKHGHGSKWQGIVVPNGLIIVMDGPYEGRASDLTMYLDSGLDQRIQDLMKGKERLYLFGDQAYSCQHNILTPYPTPSTLAEQRFNSSLQIARLSVEWAFGWVVGRFTANHFHKNLKTNLQPIGPLWSVSVLLANCLTCLKGGNQISDKFGMRPPSLQVYLGSGC